MNKLLTKIEELTHHEGLEPETITLLKMAAEAQRTGKMPPLPITLQPLPSPKALERTSQILTDANC